jgi:ribose-phosphate pyrophosphokinase
MMATLNGLKVKLFTLNANRPLAEKISEYTKIPISELEVRRFSDGEIQINIAETVRGHHVFVVQPTQTPVNEHIMELLIMMDALRRASAKTINIVMPYYGYSRQDRKAKSRQPISAKLVANLLTTAGATRVISMDLHAAQIQGFFDIPIDNFKAMPIIANYFEERLKGEDIVVVSPDHGGAVRARELGDTLHAPIAIIDKRRPKDNEAEVMNIIGDVDGKVAVIIDDIIDTAGTIKAASTAIKKAGASAVYAACTHPVLSGEAIIKINESPIEELICTDTILLDSSQKSPKIKQLSIANLLGQGILNIINNESLSVLFEKQ